MATSNSSWDTSWICMVLLSFPLFYTRPIISALFACETTLKHMRFDVVGGTNELVQIDSKRLIPTCYSLSLSGEAAFDPELKMKLQLQ